MYTHRETFNRRVWSVQTNETVSQLIGSCSGRIGITDSAWPLHKDFVLDMASSDGPSVVEEHTSGVVPTMQGQVVLAAIHQ